MMIRPESDLVRVTHRLLKERPIMLTTRRIAEETGLSRSFIDKFAKDKAVGVPSCDRIETLFKYLTRTDSRTFREHIDLMVAKGAGWTIFRS